MIKSLFDLNNRILLLLLLLSSSNSLFSANQNLLVPEDKDPQQEILDAAFGEQIDDLFDSILPYPKNPHFVISGFGLAEDLNARIFRHTATSLGYIKRSRQIYPSMGVKEVIFPFHVFL